MLSLTLSNTNPGPTASQKAVRHFIAWARVLISATLSLMPERKQQFRKLTILQKSTLYDT
jgi:hypothetical protein